MSAQIVYLSHEGIGKITHLFGFINHTWHKIFSSLLTFYLLIYIIIYNVATGGAFNNTNLVNSPWWEIVSIIWLLSTKVFNINILGVINDDYIDGFIICTSKPKSIHCLCVVLLDIFLLNICRYSVFISLLDYSFHFIMPNNRFKVIQFFKPSILINLFFIQFHWIRKLFFISINISQTHPLLHSLAIIIYSKLFLCCFLYNIFHPLFSYTWMNLNITNKIVIHPLRLFFFNIIIHINPEGSEFAPSKNWYRWYSFIFPFFVFMLL